MDTAPVTPAPSAALRPAPPAAPAGNATPAPAALLPMLLMVLRVGLLATAATVCFAYSRATGTPLASALLWMNALIVGVDVVCLSTLANVLRQEGGSLRALLATRTPGRDIVLGLGLFVVVAVAFLGASFLANLVVYHGPPPRTGVAPRVPLGLGLLSVAVMPATVAVAEEAIYRAYPLPGLAGRLGRVGAVVVMALVFGTQHVFFSIESPQAMAARFLTTFLAGLVLGALWFAAGRIWPLIVAHLLLDVVFLGLPVLAMALGAGA